MGRKNNYWEKIKSFSLSGNIQRAIQIYSKYKLKINKDLWEVLEKYIEKSKSTGCSYIDYRELYYYIRQNKPKEILECGTGAPIHHQKK